MPQIELAGRLVTVCDDGFMEDASQWNLEVAAALARAEGVPELTDRHWKVINTIRDYYLKRGLAPTLRKLCKESGATLKDLYELFPSGPARGACKIAGLPKPTGCV